MTDSTNPKLLVLTSTFPVSPEAGDNFVSQLCYQLSGNFQITVLAPQTKGSAEKGTFHDLEIVRYKVTPFGNLGLTQNSGIVSNIRRAPWLILISPWLIFSQVAALKKMVKENNFSAIHAHWLIPSGFSAALYKKLFNKNIKLIVTAHGSDINKFNFLPFSFIKKFTLSQVDTLSTVSQDLKQKVLDLGYRKEIPVVPMGVDTSKFSPEYFSVELAKIYNKPVLLYVGTVIKNKGVEVLLKSMRILVEKFPQATLLLIGDGNYLEQSRSLTSYMKLEENIKFLGRLPNSELPKYHATCNVFVLPSLSEGFPVVISEALSSGSLCVTSDLPVFKQLEDSGNFLITSERQNQGDLAKKMVEILELSQDDKQSRRLAARKYAEKNLSWEKVSQEYVKMFYENINSH